jgi:hypothetical protein
MSEEWLLSMHLRHTEGLAEFKRDVKIVCKLDITSSRTVDDMRIGAVDFTEAVVVMKRKPIRREQLRAMAAQLAEQIADSIEDAEGWHGEDRRRGTGVEL